jgi:cytochrome c oxidase subunit 2
MTFLIYIILILVAAAIWQLVRVVELSAKLKGGDPNKVTERDNRMNGRLMMLVYFLIMGFFFWEIYEYGDKLLPVSGSEHGEKIDWLLHFNLLIITVVFVITNFLLFFMAFKYYGRDGQKATFFPHNNKLEMLWTGVPAVVLFIIIFLGIRLWNDTTTPASEGTRLIEIYAKQFSFTARYSGADNKLGKANYRLIKGVNELGLDSTDAAAYDDVIVTDTLFLPVNEEVNFHMRSRDVIHSAYFPQFRAQMNCVPGMVTFFHFKPVRTTAEMRKDPQVIRQMAEINALRDQWNLDHPNETPKEHVEWDYVLLCTKICGASHFNMQLKIVVGTKEEYHAWLKRHQPFYAGKTAPAKKVAQN